MRALMGLTLSATLLLAACTGGATDESSASAAAAPEQGIHLLAPEGWTDATLVSGPSNGLAAQRTEMTKVADGEFVAERPAGENLYFRFESDSGETLDLGGTMGTYPGDPLEDFVTNRDDLWVDQYGLLHASDPRAENPDELTFLTVNLHTYQDRQAVMKLNTVATAINALGADIITLQEAAQGKDSEVVGENYGVEIKADNAALLIVQQLKAEYGQDYSYFWDWSHYGWDVWEEGSAILTNAEIVSTEAKFVTKNKEKTFWKSRNIPMATIKTPNHGTVNAYSVHLGWWDDEEEPFKYSFDQLLKWSESLAPNADSSIFGGDFNNPAGTEGYDYIMDTADFVDVYLTANPAGMTDPTIGGNIDGWEEGDPSGKRIDYIFLAPGGTLEPVLAQRTFTESSMGRVSDHNGTYAVFVNKPGASPSASASATASETASASESASEPASEPASETSSESASPSGS